MAQPSLRSMKSGNGIDIPAAENIEVKEEEEAKLNLQTEIRNAKDFESRLLSLAPLVPVRVIKYHLNQKNGETLRPFSVEYEAAVLFADISGFSALAEKLAEDLNCQANAAENLSRHIGKSLEKMVFAVCSVGGDVIKFAGDAILALFPASKFDNDLARATHCCVQVAMNMIYLDLEAGGVKLSVHCGVGAGKVVGYNVGGLYNRWEYVITGDPVDQIGSAEPEANAGEVVISKEAGALLPKLINGQVLESQNIRVDSLRNIIDFPPTPMVVEELHACLSTNKDRSRMTKLLRSYVPRPVLQSIDSGEGPWVAELRICTTLFCRLKGLQFKSTDDLGLIQEAVKTVQNQLYVYEGTLCRFIVDDKGAGLLLAFGLPPFMHENDPVRATKSALQMHSAVKKLSTKTRKLSCSIGVTSGRVFCGTVGGQIRCEYTLHGTVVNLAARYMVAAKDGVLCGESTYNDSRQQVVFAKPESIKVKGRTEPVNVYRPVSTKLVNFQFNADYNQIGRSKEETELHGYLKFFHRQNSLSYKKIAIYQGEGGIGKSRFIQYAHRRIQKFKRFHLVLGVGSDTEKAKPFFVWGPMLIQLASHYYNFMVIKYLNDSLQGAVRKKVVEENHGEQTVIDATLGRLAFADFPNFADLTGEDKLVFVEGIVPPDEKFKKLIPLLSSIIPSIVKSDANSPGVAGVVRTNNLALLIREMVIRYTSEISRAGSGKKSISSMMGEDEAITFNGRASSMDGLANIKEDPNQSNNVYTPNGSVRKEEKEPSATREDEMLKEMRDRNSSGNRDRHVRDRLIIVVEDIHWVDPNSLELLVDIAADVNQILILCTCRDFASGTHASDLRRTQFQRLCELPETEVHQLRYFYYEEVREAMCQWLNVSNVPDKAVSAVFAKSGGQPLFSEELCKLMARDGILQKDGDKCILSRKAQEEKIGLPDSISALMTSRLDKLEPSKQRILKCASVIGREFFSHELYELMTSGEDSAVKAKEHIGDDINALVNEVFLVKAHNSSNQYRFASALLKESAYNLLLFKDRKELHLKAARYYEERHKEYLEVVYSVLANHYFHAEEYKDEIKDSTSGTGKTKTYLERAGDLALEMDAMEEVWLCFSRLIDMDPEYTQEITTMKRAVWNEKAGTALTAMGKHEYAHEYLYRSLHLLQLDNRQIVSVDQCGFFGFKGKGLRLVTKLPNFNTYASECDVALLVTGAKAYSELTKLRTRKDKKEEKERRENAIILAEAAFARVSEHKERMDTQLMDEIHAELATAYANASVFYTATEGVKDVNKALDYYAKASQAVEQVTSSETQAMVHYQCAHHAVMIGRMKAAFVQLKKATWICQFRKYTSLLVKSTYLSVTVNLFMGKLGAAQKAIATLYKETATVEIGNTLALVSCLCGDFEVTEKILAKHDKVSTGAFVAKSSEVMQDYLQRDDLEGCVALAYLLKYKYDEWDNASKLVFHAAKIVASRGNIGLPITMFHTLTQLVQIYVGGLDVDGSTPKKVSFSINRNSILPSNLQNAMLHANMTGALRPVLKLLDKYARAYPSCIPHVELCKALVATFIASNLRVKLFKKAIAVAKDMNQPYVVGLAYFQMACGDKLSNRLDHVDNSRRAFSQCTVPSGKLVIGPYELKKLEKY